MVQAMPSPRLDTGWSCVPHGARLNARRTQTAWQLICLKAEFCTTHYSRNSHSWSCAHTNTTQRRVAWLIGAHLPSVRCLLCMYVCVCVLMRTSSAAQASASMNSHYTRWAAAAAPHPYRMRVDCWRSRADTQYWNKYSFPPCVGHFTLCGLCGLSARVMRRIGSKTEHFLIMYTAHRAYYTRGGVLLCNVHLI